MIKNETYKIHLFQEQKKVSCSGDCFLLNATLAASINHTHACGGKGECSTCRISVMEGIENCNPRNAAEQRIANKLNFPKEIRLACQTKISGDITIRRIVMDKLDMELISEQFSIDTGITFGSQRELTIVFTDIINYTAFAEKFPPYDTVHVLNRYFRIMNSVIEANHGIISDVAGDGILAVFGLNETRENSVADAIKGIEEMNEKLKLFNVYLQANFNIDFGIRAGIHFGSVIFGPLDTGKMKKLAIIGDNVNYASRIEAANKKFDTRLLLSEEAYKKIQDHYPKHNTYTTTLKGKTGKYRLYEILD